MNWEEGMLAKLQPIASQYLFRMATCDWCRKVVLSEPQLAFLVSGDWSTKNCKICGRNEEPHNEGRIDHKFEPSKPMPVDRFYCGCGGWD